MSSEAVILKPACIKTLSAVEARPERSNQHEFNGVQQLKEIFGLYEFERTAIFSVRGENISELVKVTWYDARSNHPARSEFRLYFQTNRVMQQAREGDNIIIGFDKKYRLYLILIPSGAKGFRFNVDGWEYI